MAPKTTTPIQASVNKASAFAVGASALAVLLCMVFTFGLAVRLEGADERITAAEARTDDRIAAAIKADVTTAANRAIFEAKTVEYNLVTYSGADAADVSGLVHARENLEAEIFYYEPGRRVAVERDIDAVYAAADAALRAAE